MNLNLNPAVLTALKTLSELENRPPDLIVSDLILAKCESLDIDPKIIEGLKAQLAVYQSTGKAYDWDEVDAWMGSWFTDNEKPEPQCQKYESMK